MTQRDLAGLLNINVKTLRKWKKDRPQVYRLLLLGLEAQNILQNLTATNSKKCLKIGTLKSKFR